MIKFRDLYNAMKNAENAYVRMGVDIDAAMCGMPKCVLSRAQQDLLDSYMDLANLDIDFCELDFQEIIIRINDCFDCVTDEFAGLLPPPLPEPEYTVDLCKGSSVIPIDHIKRFRIYERTYTHPTIPSPTQVYVMSKESLPYTFTPSVPEQHTSNEKYAVSWNNQRNSLRVKMTHDRYDHLSPRDGSFNICMIVAEIDDQFQEYYGADEVKACAAYLMTPDVKWVTNHELDKAVDGDPATYTMADGEYTEIVCEFVFKA